MNTNLIRFFCSKCDLNLIQYQIMQYFICMERSACQKVFFKRTRCQYFEHSPCASETVLDNYDGHSRTRDSSQMLYKADLLSEMAPVLMGSERNGPPVEFVIFSVCPISGGLQSTFFVRTIDYSVNNCFMNIKMKSNMINVEINFRDAIHSAAFVSGRLLRFHIPKFHPITVTC